MIDYIKLGDTDYPVSFGFAALRECEKEKDGDVAELIEDLLMGNSVGDKVHLCYLGVKHGLRQEKQDPITEEDLTDLLDEPGKMVELLGIIGSHLGKIFALPQVVEQNPE